MPVVPKDPVSASWNLEVGTTGLTPMTAEVTSATLTYDDGASSFAQGIVVAPPTVAVPAGSTSSYGQRKTGALADLPSDCAWCGDSVTLDLEFLLEGTWTINESVGPVSLACAF